jgi:hypothetical protein
MFALYLPLNAHPGARIPRRLTTIPQPGPAPAVPPLHRLVGVVAEQHADPELDRAERLGAHPFVR